MSKKFLITGALAADAHRIGLKPIRAGSGRHGANARGRSAITVSSGSA